MTQSTNKIDTNIEAIREAYGESQQDLAHAVGVDSPGTIEEPEGCKACGGEYPLCAESCPLFD